MKKQNRVNGNYQEKNRPYSNKSQLKINSALTTYSPSHAQNWEYQANPPPPHHSRTGLQVQPSGMNPSRK